MPPRSIWAGMRAQWTSLPLHRVDLTGQTVMVTGSNVGLGLEAAKHFARMNPKRLVMAVRNRAKGEKALEELRKETGYSGGEVMTIDQSDFASVSAFATEFREKHDRLDVLVANAGVYLFERIRTKDGWESSIQVNHLSTSLLILLLLPMLVQTGQQYNSTPTVTLVTTEPYNMITGFSDQVMAQPGILAALSDPTLSGTASTTMLYPQSKLFNVMFARTITAKLPPTSPVVFNSVNPGFVHSEIRRDVPWMLRPIFGLLGLIFARTTPEGAKTYVWPALVGKSDANIRDQIRGAYTSDCEIGDFSDFLLSTNGQAVEKRIWDETLEVLQQVDPRVQEIAKECFRN